VFGQSRAKKAASEQQAAADGWQAQRDAYADLVRTARTYKGSTSSDLMLKTGEAVFLEVTGASLVEARAGKGHYQGRSQGVSIPVGSIGGRAVRYRVGASKGHYVQSAPVAMAIDTGTVYITNRRVIFQGTKQTRECDFAKLIGFQHDDRMGSTTFSVSNRQKPTTVRYGPSLSGSFDFRLDLALAHFKGTVAQLVRQLESELADIDARRPAGVASPAPAASTVPVGSPRQRYAAWAGGSGGHALTDVNQAIKGMLEAGGRVRSEEVTSEEMQDAIQACDRLLAATTAAMQAQPVPDQAAQDCWAQALTGLWGWATFSRSALVTGDAESIQKAMQQQDAGIRRLGELGQHFRRMSTS
jgi:hypothetical protein